MNLLVEKTRKINLLVIYINKIKELDEAITILDKYGEYTNFIFAIRNYMEIANNPIISNYKLLNMIIEQLEEKLTILVESCL